MDRTEYAEKANELLEQAYLDRSRLADWAGLSAASLRTALAPSTASRTGALPRMLRAMANALELKARDLVRLAGEMRALADQPPSENST